jgi:tetratricopeptide (TPR) repeat protein
MATTDPQPRDGKHAVDVHAEITGLSAYAILNKVHLLYQECNKNDTDNARYFREIVPVIDQMLQQARLLAADDPAALAEVLNTLGFMLWERGDLATALRHLDHALALAPESVPIHFNRGAILLSVGRYTEGWLDWGWPWIREQHRRTFLPATPDHAFALAHRQPIWDGTRAAGRTILLLADQGMGDALLFIRYAQTVAGMGARVVLQCHRRMAALMSRAAGVHAVIARGAAWPADIDEYAPLTRLPAIIDAGSRLLSETVPYLTADPQRCAVWRQMLDNHWGPRRPERLRVGLVWAATVTNARDFHRSLRDITRLAPLLTVDGIDFVSVQGDDSAQLLDRWRADGGPANRILDVRDALGDFMETAALLTQLDLLIGVDGAVVNAAGALGVPVWVLVGSVCDWRWLPGDTSTPWFPTARMFRQRQPGDWSTVIEQVREALVIMVQERQHSSGHAVLEQAMLAYQQQDYPRAVALCQTATRSLPERADGWCLLGMALRQTGALVDAVGAYRQALLLRPDYPEANHNLDNLLRHAIDAIRQPSTAIGLYLLTRCEQQSGNRVMSGIFAGMQLPDDGFYWKLQMLIGVYEAELHPWLHEWITAYHNAARSYTRLINIGCGEGYYAVGLARLWSQTRVYAFDNDERAQALCRHTATLNGVLDQMEIAGYCDPAMLQTTIDPNRTLLVIDCEGCEYALLDPALVPALAHCDLLIECHDHLPVPNGPAPTRSISDTLRLRFAATHRVEAIRSGARDPNTVPFMDNMNDLLRWLSVCEYRGGVQTWLRLTAHLSFT